MMSHQPQMNTGDDTDSSADSGDAPSFSDTSPKPAAVTPRCHAAWLLLGVQNTGKSYCLRQLLHLLPLKQPLFLFSADRPSFAFLPSSTKHYGLSPDLMTNVKQILNHHDHVTVIIDDFPILPQSIRLLRLVLNIDLPKSNSTLFLCAHNVTNSYSFSSFVMIFDKLIIPLNQQNARLHSQLLKILGQGADDDAWPAQLPSFQSGGFWCFSTQDRSAVPFYYRHEPCLSLDAITPPKYLRSVHFLLNTLPAEYLDQQCLTFGGTRIHILDFLARHSQQTIGQCKWFRQFSRSLWRRHKITLPQCLWEASPSVSS